MSNEAVKVVIACGSGLCSSGVAKVKIQEMADDMGIPVDVSTCNLSELEGKEKSADILCTTMQYQFPDEVERGICVFPLITGLNAGECKDTLKTWLQEVYNG